MIAGRAAHESWPLHRPFVIAGRTYETADVVVAELTDGVHRGRGEASPTSYYDETVEGVVSQAGQMLSRLAKNAGDWDALHDRLPPGAARNAVDCAMWDLRAKQAGRRVWELLGLPAPEPLATAFTVGIDTPAAMARRATASGHTLIKLKLGSTDDLECVRAVREALPDARIIVDANEAWTPEALVAILPSLRQLRIALVEQPLPRAQDGALASIDRLVPVCADESCHVTADLPALAGRYDAINVKLDKTGGLTEALRLRERAAALGFTVMVGCMEATSLSMAPAVLVAQGCAFVDLDGPLLIGRDREPGLHYERGIVSPPAAGLWG